MVARSATANVNQSGHSRVLLQVSLAAERALFPVTVTAASGRSLSGDVVVVAGQLLSTPLTPLNGSDRCYLALDGSLNCDRLGVFPGPFVSVRDNCALEAKGEVWCFNRADGGALERSDRGVNDAVEASQAWTLTRSGRVLDSSGVTLSANATDIDCMGQECCLLEGPGGSWPVEVRLDLLERHRVLRQPSLSWYQSKSASSISARSEPSCASMALVSAACAAVGSN